MQEEDVSEKRDVHSMQSIPIYAVPYHHVQKLYPQRLAMDAHHEDSSRTPCALRFL